MSKKIVVITVLTALLICLLTACAPDVYGDWVDDKGTVFSFGTNKVTFDGEECPYVAKDGVIQIQFTTDVFGSETSFVMDGTYAIKGNKMTLTIGKSTVYDLTRY